MKEKQPTKFPFKLLKWFCNPIYHRDIEGDLLEIYHRRRDDFGEKKANWLLMKDVLLLFRPGIVNNLTIGNKNNNVDMIRYNFILAIRNFKRYKTTFLVNLLGLSTGMACVLLIYLWVNDELKIDKFLEKDDQIYQVLQNTKRLNGVETIEATPGILASHMVKELPEVEYSVSVIPPTFNTSKGIISFDDQRIKSAGQYVSADFFKVFAYPLLAGDKNRVFEQKHGVVISEDLALKLFNSPNQAIGKIIEWKAQNIVGSCFVTGVFESLPLNATQQFDLLLNYNWYQDFHPSGDWGNSSPRTYILLKEGTSIDNFNNKISNYIQSKNKNMAATLMVQRFSDKYLNGHYENGVIAGGRIDYIKWLTIIAFLIIVIACINFMNLSTAKVSRKAKEIRVKKAFGASRRLFIFQYMQESMMMSFISLIAAGGIVLFLISPFNEFTGKHLSLDFSFWSIVMVILVTILLGFLLGIYPALYMSNVNLSRFSIGSTNTYLNQHRTRKGHIIFQFAITFILIVSLTVITKQLDYIQSNKILGFKRDHVLSFNVEKINETFLTNLKNIPGVVNAGGGRIYVGNSLGGTNDIHWEGKSQENEEFFSVLWAGYDLIETLGMEVVEGHAFSPSFGSHHQIMFNEEAIHRMGIENPIGKTVEIGGEKKQITGLVKDFHFESHYSN